MYKNEQIQIVLSEVKSKGQKPSVKDDPVEKIVKL